MKDTRSVEARLDRYIRENGLTTGTVLPPDHELAERMHCDISATSEALRNAERRGKVRRDADGRVVLLPPPRIQDLAFSFAKSAEAHGEALVTEVLECQLRPPIQDSEHPFSGMENRAHSALGLQGRAPFIAIIRLRHLHSEPRAFHRAYLDPAKFTRKDGDFMKEHDFAKESLIQLYQDFGYEPTSRDTVLTARFPNRYEENATRRKGADIHLSPVLDAEQKLFAFDPKAGQSFLLEYLQATYLGHWHYEIKNRPAASKLA